MKYTHLFWDWNGTLLDDADAAFRAVNDLLAKREMPPITMEQYYSYIDTPIIRFYERLFDLNTHDYAEILRDYQAGYTHHLNQSGLAKGAKSLLQHVHELGLKQIIVSACEQTQLLAYTSKFGISDYFDKILGASDFKAESKVSRALHFLQVERIQPHRILMVGDTLHDYETARAIGADCVLLAAGHQHKEDLLPCGVPVIDALSELLGYL